MRILITGANGFLGRALLPRLAARHEVVSLGRTASDGVSGHVTADLAKAGDLEGRIAAGALPARVDAILHLAVSRLHRTFPDTALDMFQVNVAATAALMDYAVRAGATHVILGSTGTVYHPFKDRPLAEDETTRPKSYFGWSKLAAEELAAQYAPGHFSLFVPRFFVPYGPGQADRMTDGLVKRVREGAPVTLPPEGRGLVSAPIYLDDAVRVVEQALAERWTGICNVAGPEQLTLADMAEAIGSVLGRAPVFERKEGASTAVILPDLSRLRELTDIDAFVPFREGIRRTIEAERE